MASESAGRRSDRPEVPESCAAQIWPCFAARAVLASLLAGAALLLPFSPQSDFAVAFAAFAFADGGLSVWIGWRCRGAKGEKWSILIVSGLLGFCVSLLLVFPVFDTSYRLTVLALVMAWAALTGTLHAVAAIGMRRDHLCKQRLGRSGLISIALAVALPIYFVLNKGSPLLSADLIIGVYGLAVAASWASLASALRKEAQKRPV